MLKLTSAGARCTPSAISIPASLPSTFPLPCLSLLPPLLLVELVKDRKKEEKGPMRQAKGESSRGDRPELDAIAVTKP
jgi:hypothetical protein